MKERLEHAGLVAAEGLFSALPRSGAMAVGRGIGRAAHALGVRRDVVERQIAEAFPDRPAAWVRATARDCYRHFGAELAELARARSERLVERTAGGDRLLAVWEEATASGRGGLIVTGHLGNWELAGAAVAAHGVPISAVVKAQRNPRVDRHLAELRRGLGVEPILMHRAGRGVADALERGRAVALVADQDALSRGVFVPFLGRPASTFRGPAALALRHEVPLLFGVMVREGEGWRMIVERVETRGRDERSLTAAWVRRLEREVRERPGQYFWFHRRWKTRPADVDGGDAGPGSETHPAGTP